MTAPAAPRKRGTLTASTAPTAASRRRATAASHAAAPPETDQATQELAARLQRVSLQAGTSSSRVAAPRAVLPREGSSAKGKAPAKEPSRAEVIAQASATVNNAIKTLAAGRKTGSDTSKRKTILDAKAALLVLRQSREHVELQKQLEIEKAALIIVSHCNDAGLYDLSLTQLHATKTSLVRLYASSPSDESTRLQDGLERLSIASESEPSKQSTRRRASGGPVSVEPKSAIGLLSPVPLPSADTTLDGIWNCLLLFYHHCIACILGQTSSRPSEQKSKIRHLCECLTLSREGGPRGPRHIIRMMPTGTTEYLKAQQTISAIYTLLARKLQETEVTVGADILDILQLEIYALLCLAENESYFDKPSFPAGLPEIDASIDRPVDYLGMQLHRVTTSFCKSCVSSGKTDADLAGLLHGPLQPILKSACRVVKPPSRLAENKRFQAFVAFVSRIGRKGDDPSLSESVLALQATVSSPPSPIDASPDNPLERLRQLLSFLDREALTLEAAATAGTLSAYDSSKTLGALSALRDLLRSSAVPESIADNVASTLEKLQYHPLKSIKGQQGDSVFLPVRPLLEAVVATVDCLTIPPACLVLAAADTLLQLAKRIFASAKQSSSETLEVLLRASKLADSANAGQRYEILRCTASTAYQLGAILYNDDQAARAIGLLKLACQCMKDALIAIKNDSNPHDTGEFQAKLAQRLELLGLAHQCIGEKHEAITYYGESIVVSVRQALQAKSADRLREDKGFCKTLSRYTRLGLFDSLLSADNMGIPRLLANADLECPAQVQGDLLMLQTELLWPYIFREITLLAMTSWIRQCRNLLTESGDSLRLAKCLLIQMDLSSRYTGTLSEAELWECDSIIQRICENAAIHDAVLPLDSCRSSKYFKANSRLYLCLDAVRRGNADCSTVLAREAKVALELLPSQHCRSVPPSRKSISPKSARQEAITKSKLRHSPKTFAKQAPETMAASKLLSPRNPHQKSKSRCRQVTPPRNPKNAVRDRSESPTVSVAGSLEDQALPERMLSALGMSMVAEISQLNRSSENLVSLLGLFEHTFLRISFLNEIMRVTQLSNADAHATHKNQLVHEYLRLGKYDYASSALGEAISNAPIITPNKVLDLLARSDLACKTGHPDKAFDIYSKACQLFEDDSDWPESRETASKLISRSRHLRLVSMAAMTFSRIRSDQGYVAEAEAAALQAARLANRAFSNLSRITAAPLLQEKPVSAADLQREPQAGHSRRQEAAIQSGALAGLLLRDQLDILSWLAELYCTQGTPRSAILCLEQACNLASSVKAPRLRARLLAKQVEMSLSMSERDQAEQQLQELAGMATQDGGIALLEVSRLELLLPTDSPCEEIEAKVSKCLSTWKKLAVAFERTVKACNPGHEVSAGTKSRDLFLPDLHDSLIYSLVKALKNEDRFDEAQQRLISFASRSLSPRGAVIHNVTVAELALQNTLSQLRMHPVFGILHEAAISAPLLIAAKHMTGGHAAKRHSSMLDEVELLFLKAASLHPAGSPPIAWRLICSAIAQSRLLLANVAPDAWPNQAASITAAIENGTAIALRRERLCSLYRSLHEKRADLSFPTPAEEPESNAQPSRQRTLALYKRYTSSTNNPTLSGSQLRRILPSNWTVLSVQLNTDKKSLLISQETAAHDPVVFHIPLDRIGKRNTEDSLYDYDFVAEQLSEIVKSSNETSQNAKNIQDRTGRMEWWKQRKELERRLQALLIGIEERWLGPFKYVLAKPTCSLHADETASLVDKWHSLFSKTFFSKTGQQYGDLDLNSVLLEFLGSLPSDCSDDDLEDILHFIVDSCQFAGMHIACDEIDVDQFVLDMRTILETRSPPSSAPTNDHIFLVLDSSLQPIPWESLPCMDGRSISRLPNVSFLLDHLDGANGGAADTGTASVVADLRKTYFVLNPSGDLKHTQTEFESSLRAHDWKGIVARHPMEEEVRQALIAHDIFLYFGHGGGEQYIRSNVIRDLPKCATTFLWGCSSGALTPQGEYEPFGNPYTYLAAGAPAVVANLWDVTDKDIDRFTQSTFEKLGLGAKSSTLEGATIPQAIAASRRACNLRFLNGAAPVVWGVPVLLRSQI